MMQVAHATIDLQRIAAGRRPWHTAVALFGAGGGAAALLADLALTALHNGHAGAAGALLLLTLLAAGLAWAARPGELCRLAWCLLGPHLARRRQRHAAAAQHERVDLLARALDFIFSILRRLSKLIHAGAVVIIGNRLLANVCISPRIVSQRPN